MSQKQVTIGAYYSVLVMVFKALFCGTVKGQVIRIKIVTNYYDMNMYL